MAYLDYPGLTHYDEKLKQWIDGPDSDIAHRSGDETLEGVKTFQNTAEGHSEGQTVTDLVIRNPVVVRGIPLEDGPSFTRILLADKDGDTEETFAGRLGLLEVMSPKENDSVGEHLELRCYKYSSSQSDVGTYAALRTGFDASGVPYASAISTPLPSVRNNGSDIITRNFIPLDDRIVHTTGNESIAGDKTFTNNLAVSMSTPIVDLKNTGTSGSYCDIRLDASGGSSTTILRDSYQGNFSIGHSCQGGSWTSGASLDFYYSDGSFSLSARSGADATRINLIGTGAGTLKWNGQTIQTTSDERLKTPISEVPDAVLDAWEDVDWGQFRYLDAVKAKGDSARLHLGLIAQRVKAVFEDRGLDACEYGILCYEEEADLWMVRYAEAQAMEAACQRRRADRLEARIAALEAKLA